MYFNIFRFLLVNYSRQLFCSDCNWTTFNYEQLVVWQVLLGVLTTRRCLYNRSCRKLFLTLDEVLWNRLSTRDDNVTVTWTGLNLTVICLFSTDHSVCVKDEERERNDGQLVVNALSLCSINWWECAGTLLINTVPVWKLPHQEE